MLAGFGSVPSQSPSSSSTESLPELRVARCEEKPASAAPVGRGGPCGRGAQGASPASCCATSLIFCTCSSTTPEGNAGGMSRSCSRSGGLRQGGSPAEDEGRETEIGDGTRSITINSTSSSSRLPSMYVLVRSSPILN
jgi:hypothetical protein